MFPTWSLTLGQPVRTVFLLTSPRTVPVHRPSELPTGHQKNAGNLWNQTDLTAVPQLCEQSPQPNVRIQAEKCKSKGYRHTLFFLSSWSSIICALLSYPWKSTRKSMLFGSQSVQYTHIHTVYVQMWTYTDKHTQLPGVWAVGPRQFCWPPQGGSCQWVAQTCLQGFHGNDSQSLSLDLKIDKVPSGQWLGRTNFHHWLFLRDTYHFGILAFV